MKCFKCDKQLERIFPDSKPEEDGREPSRGLIFSASGNYGSRIWDPTMTAPELVIWICDECIVRNHDQVQMRSYAYIQAQISWDDFDPERSFW